MCEKIVVCFSESCDYEARRVENSRMGRLRGREQKASLGRPVSKEMEKIGPDAGRW